MKKFLLLSSVVSLIFAYEGCGVNKKEALSNLSNSIYVEISNNFQKKESYSKNSFFEFFSKNVKNKTSQTSHVILKNVKFIKKNNLICATISEKDLLQSAYTAKKELLNFKLSNLPDDFELKYKKAKELKNKIAFVKAVLGNKLKPYEIDKLNRLEKSLDKVLNLSEVVFNVNIPNAKIKISGINRTFSPSQPIILREGSYSYKVEVAGKCPSEGSFLVKKGEIKKIDVNLGDYPQIIIKSNVNAIAKINNKPVPLNAPYTIHKCKGAAIYQVIFDGDKESGTIDLTPNLKKEINANFLTREEKKALREVENYYQKAKGVEILYGYGISKNKEWDKEKRIAIKRFNNYGIYQFYNEVVFGTQNSVTLNELNEFELLIGGRLQLSEFNGKILRIGSFLFVPYLDIQGGWDFYKFFKDGFKNSYWASANITSMVRGGLGFNIMFHRQFGVDFKYAHDFVEKRDNIFSGGLILQF